MYKSVCARKMGMVSVILKVPDGYNDIVLVLTIKEGSRYVICNRIS